MPIYTTNHINVLRQRVFKDRSVAKMAFVVMIAGMLLLTGCSDDDSFEGVDVLELENKSFTFADARVFGLPAQAATLDIGAFGDGALSDDEAPFTLTSNGVVASGILDLDEGDNPLGSDFSRCDFAIDISGFPGALGPGEAVDTDCEVSENDLELQLTNRDTDEVSTGLLVQ
jgi:hypothetical protein